MNENEWDWSWQHMKEKNVREAKVWSIVFAIVAGCVFILASIEWSFGIFLIGLFEYLMFLAFLDKGFMAVKSLEWERTRR